MIINLNGIDDNLILESRGIPNIVRDIVEVIYKKYENTKPSNDKLGLLYNIQMNKSEFNESFFDELEALILIANSQYGLNSHYYPELNNWNDENKIYSKIKLRKIVTINNKDEIKELISHELLHAYNDYKLKINTNLGFIERNPNYYTPNTEELNNVRKKFIGNSKLDFLVDSIYYLMTTERGANVTQLYYELEKKKITKEKINNGEYKELTYYLNYLKINKYIENVINSLQKNELELLKEYIKHTNVSGIFSTDDMTFKKRIIRYFKDESKIVLRKMERIAKEYLKYNNIMENVAKFHPSREKMLKLIKEIELKDKKK